MPVVSELLRTEKDGSLSFGDYTLDTKTKLSDYEYKGDKYKVKTFGEITKLERNGAFVYESVPGTAVMNMNATDSEVSFLVSGNEDSQITLELEPEQDYKVFIDKVNIGKMKTNLGGKLVFSVEFDSDDVFVAVKVVKA